MKIKNASSLKEAFAKFKTWKKSRTPLKLTVLPRYETPEIFVGEIASVDEESFLVGFAESKTRSYLPPIDLGDASFVIGKFVLEARRPTGDVLTCEELRQ